MNPFKELQRVRDELLDKMEQVLQENVLVIAELERKKFEATEKISGFLWYTGKTNRIERGKHGRYGI